MTFSYSSMEPVAACHALGVNGEHVEKLQMQTLDSVKERLNLPQPDYMKIDVDGSELRVLVGAEKCLAGARGLQVEIDDRLPASTRVPGFLSDRGFSAVGWHRHHEGPISNVWFTR